MKAERDLARTFQDICILYELALASGTSLDLVENCRHFLTALAARRGFSFSAVWLRGALLPEGQDERSLELVYAAPRVQIREESLEADHALWQTVGERGPFSFEVADETAGAWITESGVTTGVGVVFPLNGLGFLKVYSATRDTVLDEVELAQLDTVVRKFAESVEACLVHARLQREVASRERAEEEREAIRQRLQHGQKMEAVGRLAGGIAHDFNNLLVGVLGTVELLQLEEGLSADLYADLEVIQNAGQRGAELTRQLLAFARTNEEDARPVDLDAVVSEVVALLRRTVDAKIEISTTLGLHNIRVSGVASRLHTMLINLAVNARDAMADGGRLRFETEEVASPMPGRRAVEPQRWCRIVVQDSGMGMPPDVVDRAFEPFYSTKAVGKGTGLGLATVYGIVRSHGGHVRIDSTIGHGTTIEVLLPAIDVALGARSEDGPSARAADREGLVLVVDDRADTRTTARRMLGRLGYKVVEAADGREALQQIEEHGPALDVVLLDVQMPTMGGVETLTHIRATRPALPVVMATGYAQTDELDALEGLGIREILTKPYTLDSLTQAIEEAERAIGAPDRDTSTV